MKKRYIKPEIYLENFELNENIAGSCAGGNTSGALQYKSNCAFAFPDEGACYFTSDSCWTGQNGYEGLGELECLEAAAAAGGYFFS